jgi:predicted neuraminidase
MRFDLKPLENDTVLRGNFVIYFNRSCRRSMLSRTPRTWPLRTAVLIASCLPPSGAQAERPGVVTTEFIFTEAPFPQCHASTVAETPNGLVAAWFGGTKEKHPDVGIWLSRHIEGNWSPSVEVANGIQSSTLRYATWNPVLFQAKNGPLLLFYKVGPSPSEWWGMLTTSNDGGATWFAARRLPDGILGPVKNKPVQLADGTLVCPSSTEDAGWRLHLERTPDHGATWTRSEPLNDGRQNGAIQPTILFHSNSRWQMLARDRRKMGIIWSLWSTDGGATWTALESTGLPNPSSGVDAVTLADGRHLLVYNHTRRAHEQADIGDSRSMLNVAVSDDGKKWQAALVLEDSPGEYSYPAVIQTGDGLVHITYTWKRHRIKHVVVDPAKLNLTPIANGEWPDGVSGDR